MEKIYVHGLGQTPDSWEKTIEKTGGAEHSICPDLTKLLGGNEASYGNLYASFSDVCSRLDGPAALCGISLGGVLALNYAIDHPEKTGALVLIAAQYQMPRALLALQNAMFRVMPKSAFQQMGFPKREAIRLCGTMAKLDFSSALHEIACPALIVCGGKDTANRKASEKLAGAIPHARLAVVHGAGHEVNREAPEELARLLRDFWVEAERE